jgi:hypothetical protein
MLRQIIVIPLLAILSFAVPSFAFSRTASAASQAEQPSTCAFVDISAFNAAEPQARCFNLEMKCAPDEKYGCFKVPLALKDGWIDGGKLGRLRELGAQFGYIDPTGRHWDVPAGFQTDGASIPLFFRALIGGPWSDSYVKAAVIHDFYIRRKGVSADAVHKVFYFALLAAGNTQRRAEEMYFAVASFGPQWANVDLATYEAAWRSRKAMLDQVTKFHQDVWEAFQESERKLEAQAAVDREVLSRALPDRTKVFTLPASDPLPALDAFIDASVRARILDLDRDTTLIHTLREQVEAELARGEGDRNNVFVVQFTSLGPQTVHFAAHTQQEVDAQIDLINQMTLQQEQADGPPAICVGECLRARANSGGAASPLPPAPRLGP